MNNTPTPRTDEKSFEDDTGYEVVSVDFARQLETELTAVTEQRDRLAKALRGAVSLAVNEPEFLIGYFLSEDAPVREALQSLNQPTP